MANNIQTAREQTELIQSALTGDASAMQATPLENDPLAVRNLAIALSHAHNAIAALTDELERVQHGLGRALR